MQKENKSMQNNFLQVGRMIECGDCHPEKYGDCKKLEKTYPPYKCNCICHSAPEVSAAPNIATPFFEPHKSLIEPTEIKPKEKMEWEEWAKIFHDKYELFAPEFGYKTRKDTKEFDPKSPNGRLMIAVCEVVLSQFLFRSQTKLLERIREEIKEIERPDLRLTKGHKEICTSCADDRAYNQALTDLSDWIRLQEKQKGIKI